MKLNLLSKAAISLALLSSVTGCTKQRVYDFGVENKHDEWTVLASIDEENERIVIDFKSKQEEVHAGFYFWFSFSFTNPNGENEHISNKDDLVRQFVYRLDDGTELEFDDDGFYVFHKSTKINVWYTYADRKVKNAIIDRKFSCEFGCGHYEPYGSMK